MVVKLSDEDQPIVVTYKTFVVACQNAARNQEQLNRLLNRIEIDSQRVSPYYDSMISPVRRMIDEDYLSLWENAQNDHEKAIYETTVSEVPSIGEHSTRAFLENLLEKLMSASADLTVVVEENHIDPSYRDMHYHHYSHEFFEANRYSLRLVFLAAALDESTYTKMSSERLSAICMGACVISPLGDGAIGRTLISPQYVIDKSIEVRLSEYSINVLGKKLKIKAFPYRKQDGEFMKCAEVTLLNLLSYYSNEYPDYHSVLPSEILLRSEKYSDERVTPSRGLSYNVLSKILSDFRFFPRLYNVHDIARIPGTLERPPEHVTFKRLMHWYVCSGIPVAVNIANPKSDEDGHSLVCIGYENIHGSGKKTADIPPQILEHSFNISGFDRKERKRRSCRLILSADFERDYVVIDDSQLPYSIRPYQHLSKDRPDFECINYVVPLHRSMAMDAMDAYANAMTILMNRRLGLLNWGGSAIDDETLVMSLFLTTVRGYKRERSKHERTKVPKDSIETNTHEVISELYEAAVFPHFVWVVEITRYASYVGDEKERKAFAELVFDASSSGAGQAIDKLIFMRYPKYVYYRGPDGQGYFMELPDDAVEEDPLEPYRENLKHVTRPTANKSSSTSKEEEGAAIED